MGLWLGALLLSLAGLAGAQPSARYFPYVTDPRVQVELGGENLAREVARALPEAIRAVEQAQQQPFMRQVSIMVSAREPSYLSATSAIPDSRGELIGDRIYLSPRLANELDRLPGTLIRNLSLLHWQYRLGESGMKRLPAWFLEGYATLLSGGAGAERVQEREAIAALHAGLRFDPELEPDPRRSAAATPGVSTDMRNRQSALFLRYLRNRDAQFFRVFIQSLQSGQSFAQTFRSSFGTEPLNLWPSFVQSLPLTSG